MAHLEAFTIFSQLPAELRLSIWKLSCEPRVVEVRYDAELDTCKTTTKPPALLHVNREAREEALTWYRPAFRTKTRHEYIFFCPSLDILYLPRHGFMGYSDTAREFNNYVVDTADCVWSLAIDHVQTDIIRPWEPYNKLCLLRSFPNLKHAFLVLGADEERGGGRAIEFVDPREDPTAVMRVINNVLESFHSEIGPGDYDSGEESEISSVPSLIPKSKVFHEESSHGWICV